MPSRLSLDFNVGKQGRADKRRIYQDVHQKHEPGGVLAPTTPHPFSLGINWQCLCRSQRSDRGLSSLTELSLSKIICEMYKGALLPQAGERVCGRSTGCSCRRPRISSRHPRGKSQLSVTPIAGNEMPSSGLQGQHSHMVHIHTQRQNTYTCKPNALQGKGSSQALPQYPPEC